MGKAVQCSAKAKTGSRCKRSAIPGGKVCRYHGGAAPQVIKAAKVRAARVEAIAEAERMVARAGVEADPLEHLLESLYRAAALVDVWGAMVAGLDAKGAKDMDEIRGEFNYNEVSHDNGVELIVTPKDPLTTVDGRGIAQVHPFVDEYNKALDRRAKFAKMCLDAGVAERQVKLAEEQAQIVARVINGVLADLQIERTQKVNKIVATQLRDATPNFG